MNDQVKVTAVQSE